MPKRQAFRLPLLALTLASNARRLPALALHLVPTVISKPSAARKLDWCVLHDEQRWSISDPEYDIGRWRRCQHGLHAGQRSALKLT